MLVKEETEGLLCSFMDVAASVERLLSREDILEFVSEIEETRDPGMLADVLHVDEHAERVSAILQAVKHAQKSAYSLREDLTPFW